MLEACRQRDVGDGLKGIESETVRRSAQTGQLNISAGRDPDIVRELTEKMEFREVCNATQSGYRQRLIQMPINEIEHPAEALGVGRFSSFLLGRHGWPLLCLARRAAA